MRREQAGRKYHATKPCPGVDLSFVLYSPYINCLLGSHADNEINPEPTPTGKRVGRAAEGPPASATMVQLFHRLLSLNSTRNHSRVLEEA